MSSYQYFKFIFKIIFIRKHIINTWVDNFLERETIIKKNSHSSKIKNSKIKTMRTNFFTKHN
jgi:hypothetical protein